MDIFIDANRIRLSDDPKSFNHSKPTILFLHDSLGCIELWRNFPNKIKEVTNCNVLSYDRQGYGKSDGFSQTERDKDYLKTEANILAKLIDILRLKEVILFGHSDGGTIALLTAALYPEKIKGIITEGAHVFVEKQTLQGVREAKIAYKTTNLKDKLTKYHYKNTEDVFIMWTDTWLSPQFIDWNIESYLSQIECNSLIIQGENDEYGTLAQVHSIVQKTSGKSEPFIIPNIGHTPHKEATELVLQKTTNFVLNL
ncbi:Pimeloyl-ACP methyl ester carboxylesterase [Aquimarina amphilecti]|uniref:Pimeloyl-ACP methyl ester carboxylesterase n=1 Tax=Aquimarina amphilecti TaxID=1038014 RepID=A0A1H7I453_AQUAM|nr:alpha/beta hydrolase [Aquimarina amphilecti]SEK57208.1 Pimeloyl-ACP methyl ester carboxylesterase [Aquimarina amphilecti]